MVERYRAGEFGNHSPTWLTLEDFLRQRPDDGYFHIRNRVAGGPTWYNVHAYDVAFRWQQLTEGLDGATPVAPSSLYISAMAPHEHNLLQGEVWQGPWGLNLHASYEIGVPMRDALSVSPFDCTGLEARLRLQQVMNDLSWEWFQWLLEAYPDHVIEFSSFSVCWGTVPGHNTVFWEIRKY